ncbi:MAG: hypothetical protein VX011_02155, partial [Candidatus Thermoplasmatota archaeon]|nr:hypothetical protein [Candidatus Thermoplasmatota archaeon]
MAMVHVTLPDGTVNGVERDLSTALHEDCNVTGISGDSDAGMHILRHSAAHLLAQAVTALYPDAKP